MANVLVVDDNEQNLYILETLLANCGHSVATAANGREALEKAQDAPPDVIVTDILMPEMDGFALCRRWKADAQLRERPLVFYTAAYTDSRDEQLATRLGADRFICKPAKFEDLAAALEEVLAARPSATKSLDNDSDEASFLKQYNQVLVRKLEEKVEELQEANHHLSASLAELQETQAGLRLRDRALASIPTGIAIVDATSEGKEIVDCNQAFVKITGYERSDVVGRRLGFLEEQDSSQPELAAVFQAIREQREMRVVLKSRRKCGAIFWSRLTVSPVHEAEQLTNYVCVYEDITDARNADVELQERERQLAHVSRVSTVGEMVSGIAHELNQPLYSIQNYSKACHNLLAREPIAAEQLGTWLDEISVAAEHAGELLLRLRNFVMRTPNERANVGLGEIIDGALTLVHRESEKRGIAISVATDEFPDVSADAVQIQQVLVNLILNAFDAVALAKVEEPRIEIHAESREGRVEVVVSDNGVGLPRSEGLRIFEAFQSTKTDGMGLGLAIGTTIVNNHGGKLWATDATSGGAAFHFTLPTKRGLTSVQ